MVGAQSYGALRRVECRGPRVPLVPLVPLVLAGLGWMPGATRAASPPHAISPGSIDRAPVVATVCPTFSWGGAAGVKAWLLAVYATGAPESNRAPALVLEKRLHGSAGSWTPAVEECLPSDGWFAWSVTALRGESEPATSDPLFFRTGGAPTIAEVRRALEVLREWRRAGGGQDSEPLAAPEPARVGSGDEGLESSEPVRRASAGGGAVSVAVSGLRDDPSVVGVGVRGASASPQAGSAGVQGLSTATTGEVSGLHASHQSAQGTAALLEAPAGGELVRGVGPGGEVFSVDAAGALVAATLTGDGSGLTGVDAETLDGVDSAFLLDHDHYGQVWSGGAVGQGLRIDTGGALVASFEGRASGKGFGVAGIATSGEGTGIAGVAQSAQGIGGLFVNSAGGTALAVGLEGTPFTVSENGDVVAASYQGDGSQLTGLLRAGQSCPPGTLMVGIEQDGSLACEPAPPQVETKTTVEGSLFPDGFVSSIVVGPDGLAIVSYHDRNNRDLVVGQCRDVLCTSASREIVDDGIGVDGAGRESSIAIGSDGLPIIAYSKESALGIDELWVAHCNDLTCSSANLETVDASFFAGFYVSVAVGTDGLPIVGYYEGDQGDLKVAHCSDLLCSASLVTTIDAMGDVGLYPSIAIGSDGRPVISYHDATGGVLKVARCDDVQCSSATLQTVSTVQPNSGLDTSLAIGADGLPVISYLDGQDNVKVAHCDDLSCISSSEHELDGGPGAYTSIAIGVDGLPIVAYSRNTITALWVAHCKDVRCESRTRRNVDQGISGVVAGRHPSIAIGSDGLPIISHSLYSESSAGLRIVHCGNRFCL